MQDSLALEDAKAKLTIEELRRRHDGGVVGENEPVKVGGMLAEGGHGRECAPDSRLDIGREERGLKRRPCPHCDPTVDKAQEERQK